MMIQVVLASLLSPLFTQSPAAVAGVKPCVWPNRCGAEPRVELAQFKPCIFPNRCGPKLADA